MNGQSYKRYKERASSAEKLLFIKLVILNGGMTDISSRGEHILVFVKLLGPSLHVSHS